GWPCQTLTATGSTRSQSLSQTRSRLRTPSAAPRVALKLGDFVCGCSTQTWINSLSFAFFVTGTDTEIGKTTIAAALLYAAKQQDLRTAACKPVASGSAPSPEGLRN